MNHRRLLPLALTLGLALVLLSAATPRDAAGQTTDAPPRPAIETLSPPSAPDGAAPNDAPLPNVVTESRWPWAKLVYQSADYGDNWEIMISNDDGSAPLRLTDHPAADIEPNLARGGQKIVFASDRDGPDLDLFVMNADGSNLRQLTFNNKDDARPVWSPDGQRIAFQAYRWGRAELFVINADGSGEQRLTAHDAYDGDATWSPDGTKLAFCSTRDAEKSAIFVMPATGGPATRISTIANSCDPVWSPDGRRIAFDAAPGQSIFTNLWVMNADGSEPRLVYQQGGDTANIWPNSWSPDGRYIAYSYMVYELYYGDWYLTKVHAQAAPADEAFDYPATLISSNRAMWPSLATLDTTPPAPAFAPLLEFSRMTGYALSWLATDGGGSGVAAFDIETRLSAAAAWTPLLTGTTATSQARDGAAGRVEYRIRAHDRAFNTSAWPNGPTAFTRLFATRLTGRITDNRGVGLPGITPAIAPWTVTNEATGDGRYLARLSALGNQTLTLSRAGYAPLPPTTRPIAADSVQEFYLPPANDAIRNGHFEATAGALDQWTTGGALPVTATSDFVSTGARAVTLGRLCSPPCLASGGEIQSEHEDSRLAVDSHGGLHLTYRGAGGNFYRYRPAGGDWLTPEPVPGNSIEQLVIDANDTLHAVSWEVPTYKVCYRRKPLGGSWTACEWVPDAGKGDFRLQVDSLGAVHLIANVRYHRRAPGGGWQLVSWPAGIQVYYGSNFRMSVDATGTAHFLFYVSGGEYGQPYPADTIVNHAYLPGGVWGPPVIVQQADSPHDDAYLPVELITDSFGRLHLIALINRYTGNLAYAVRQPNGAWSSFTTIEEAGADYISAVADSRGGIHLIYSGPDGITYRHALPGQAWSAPAVVPGDIAWDYNSRLLLGPDDMLHAVTVATEIDDDYFTRYFLAHLTVAPAGQAGVATLSQPVTIPATMNAPTLSFMKRVLRNSDGGAAVVVRVQEAGQPAQSFPITGDARWSLGWVDMTPWRGKTVSVTFAVEQPADQPAAQLWLDSVTLGSAAPQTWAAFDAPSQTQPGQTFAATLRFGNRGAVAADQAVLTLTLPPGITLASATPPPVAGQPIRWALGDLAVGATGDPITLTLVVGPGAPLGSTPLLRAALSSATPEVEMGDNQPARPIFIGWQAYFPHVMDN